MQQLFIKYIKKSTNLEQVHTLLNINLKFNAKITEKVRQIPYQMINENLYRQELQILISKDKQERHTQHAKYCFCDFIYIVFQTRRQQQITAKQTGGDSGNMIISN